MANHDGFLPLHLAIRSEKEWNGGVETLIRAHAATEAALPDDLVPYVLSQSR